MSSGVLDILDKAMYIMDQLGIMPYIQAFMIILIAVLFIKLIKD